VLCLSQKNTRDPEEENPRGRMLVLNTQFAESTKAKRIRSLARHPMKSPISRSAMKKGRGESDRQRTTKEGGTERRGAMAERSTDEREG